MKTIKISKSCEPYLIQAITMYHLKLVEKDGHNFFKACKGKAFREVSKVLNQLEN